MDYYSDDLTALISELSKLPGIGVKSAQRLAFHIVSLPQESAERLADRSQKQGIPSGTANAVRR